MNRFEAVCQNLVDTILYRCAETEKGQVTKVRATPALLVLGQGYRVSWVDAGSHFGLDESNKGRAGKVLDMKPMKNPCLPEGRLLPPWAVNQSPEARVIRAQVKPYNVFVKRHRIESRGGIGHAAISKQLA